MIFEVGFKVFWFFVSFVLVVVLVVLVELLLCFFHFVLVSFYCFW